MSGLGQGIRFARGLRNLLHHPVDPDQQWQVVVDEYMNRAKRFLDSLDRLVWSSPDSPYRPLLSHAGIEQGDVTALVDDGGLEGALSALRDAGVYVAYEEYLGRAPARRGSATFSFQPGDFFNPLVPADYMPTTGGTRSGGTPAGTSFGVVRRYAGMNLVLARLWGYGGLPAAVWFPALPGGAGMACTLGTTLLGYTPQRWFSQTDPSGNWIPLDKRLTNRFLPAIARTAGVSVPRPRYTPTSDPSPVLEWCRYVLGNDGRAVIHTFPSSGVQLAQTAVVEGLSLEGLDIRMAGEPVTASKLAAVRASGARPLHDLSFTPEGPVAFACPEGGDRVMHVLESELAVIGRRRTRPDGEWVDALCWTSLALNAPRVLINVENDDYGTLSDDGDACSCMLGRLGMRTRLADVRGISKIVAGGMTVPGEVIERLVEVTLPARFGGGPGDFQLVESEQGVLTRVAVRVHPRLGLIDDATILAAVRQELGMKDTTDLAGKVWEEAATLNVERAAPIPAPSGKVLPFETLR